MKGLWEYLYNNDKKLFEYINKKIKCRILDIFMPRITHLGGVSSLHFLPFLYLFGQSEAKTCYASLYYFDRQSGNSAAFQKHHSPQKALFSFA